MSGRLPEITFMEEETRENIQDPGDLAKKIRLQKTVSLLGSITGLAIIIGSFFIHVMVGWTVLAVFIFGGMYLTKKIT